MIKFEIIFRNWDDLLIFEKIVRKGEVIKLRTVVKNKDGKQIDITESELDEFAKKAEDLEVFTKLVLSKLELGKRGTLFKELIIAAMQINKINWK